MKLWSQHFREASSALWLPRTWVLHNRQEKRTFERENVVFTWVHLDPNQHCHGHIVVHVLFQLEYLYTTYSILTIFLRLKDLIIFLISEDLNIFLRLEDLIIFLTLKELNIFLRLKDLDFFLRLVLHTLMRKKGKVSYCIYIGSYRYV